jgi:hypothetical protein
MPLVLLASLFAGLAAAYLFSLVHPTVHENRVLSRIGNRPVLGAVSLVRNPQVIARRRRRSFAFAGGVGGLAATYTATAVAVFFRDLLPF